MKIILMIFGILLLVACGMACGCRVLNRREERDPDYTGENTNRKLRQDANFYEKYIKRLLDIVISGVAVILISPIMVISAIIVYIEDPGNVIFKQKRVGINKSYFNIHKLRSMKQDVPDIPTHLLENPDQYILKSGKIFRSTSCDELPQLIDILRGSMSLVGPRPALWNQYDLVEERDKYGANDVRPGLTGWAQINGRDELEIPVKAKLDGDYCKQLRKSSWAGFKMDCKCFFGTIKAVLRSDGVVEGGTGTLENERKRVVVLTSHTPSLFWFRMDMMRLFKTHGYDVYALGNEPESDWIDRFKEQGIVYRQIIVNRNGTNPFKDLKTLKSIKKMLEEIRPDKIFSFQAKTVIYGGIAARQLGIKEFYPLIAGMGSVFINHDMKSRLIRKIMVNEYQYAIGRNEVVFFQNEDDVTVFRECGIIKHQKVVLLPGSGVNVQRFQPGPLPDQFTFLFVGRLIKDKGVYEYLKACEKIKEKYPDVRCMLVGPYDTNPSALKPEELEPFVESGVIEYFGEQDDVKPYYDMCSVFVLPSYREGTPKTNLEAMASGRAVITTDAPGCKETVTDGYNGYLVPVKDVEMLVDRMEKMINDPTLAYEMGRKGRQIAVEKFDVDIVNDIIVKTMNM